MEEAKRGDSFLAGSKHKKDIQVMNQGSHMNLETLEERKAGRSRLLALLWKVFVVPVFSWERVAEKMVEIQGENLQQENFRVILGESSKVLSQPPRPQAG